MTEAVRVLAVCTGNLCRSPFAEAALRRALSDAFEIRSAGTSARDGQAAPPPAVVVADAEHLDLRRHRARALDPEAVSEADLILAMALEHRRSAVEQAPSAVRRSFTFLEFARLAASLTDEELAEAAAEGSSRRQRLVGILRLVSSQRGAAAPVQPDSDDVVDPYGRGDDVYRVMAQQILDALPDVVRALSFAD